MADESARIVIDGDARTAVSALEQVRRAADSVRASFRDLSAQDVRGADAAKAEAAVWKARADNINAWKRAASGVAPQFTGIIDSMEEFAEGSERVGAKAMLARAGLLAIGTAATVGATAFVAAGASIVASSAEVISNIGSYDLTLSAHREQLLEASRASAALHTEITDLRIEIAGQMAPAFTAMATSAANAIGYLEQTADLAERSRIAATLSAEGWHDTADALTASADAASYLWTSSQQLAGSGLHLLLYPLEDAYLRVAEAAGVAYRAMGYEDPEIQRQLDEVTRQRARADQMWADAVGKARAFDMEADTEAARAAQETADSYILAGSAAAERATRTGTLTTATKGQTVADREAEQAVQGVVGAWGKATSALDGYMTQLDEANRQGAAAITNYVDTLTGKAPNTVAGAAPNGAGPNPNASDLAGNEIAAQSARNAKQTAANWRSAAQEMMGAVGGMVGSVGNFVAESYAKQAAGADKYSQAHRNAMRKAFVAQKAAALAQAAISLALGIMQVWSTWSALPPVAAALTAVVGAVGAVQIGLIAAQKPSFHRGGVYGGLAPSQAPDERNASVNMLASERLAIVPARGALGAESDVARHSTGERRSDAPAAPVVYIMDGAGRRSTRPFAGLGPLVGRRRI